MYRFVVPAVSLTLSWVVFVSLHLFFLKTFLYWNIVWLDIAMHSIGGGLVVATAWYLNRSELFPRYTAVSFSHPLLLLWGLAVGWELFKYLIAPALPPSYFADTVLDLLWGMAGGLLVYLLLRSRTIQ